jgi:GTP cyclohydrolase I
MDYKDRKLFIKDAKLQKVVRDIFVAIGEDPNREGLQDTPKRVVNMWKEIFRGYDPFLQPKVTTFNNGSDGLTYDQMVTDEGKFYSQCEHHMAPFFGKYYFAYIPHPKGKILGLSKVARVVDYFSAKLQIQERLVQEIVEYLWTALCEDTKYKPIGMALLMNGTHMCKCMRGVKKEGTMKSVELKGAFKDDSKTREEFYNLIGK